LNFLSKGTGILKSLFPVCLLFKGRGNQGIAGPHRGSYPENPLHLSLRIITPENQEEFFRV
jgi:hypothetical protein